MQLAYAVTFDIQLINQLFISLYIYFNKIHASLSQKMYQYTYLIHVLTFENQSLRAQIAIKTKYESLFSILMDSKVL